MTQSVPPKNHASLRSVLNLIIEGVATRAQIFGLELSVAKDNTAKTAISIVLAALFGIFALVFISVALLVIFWDEHRVFVSCCLAGFYTVMFIFFIGRAKGLASNLPFAFVESKQIISSDLDAIRQSLNSPAKEDQEGEMHAGK